MSQLEIVPYTKELKQYFYDINHEWVSSMFKVEEVDERMLANPCKYIIEPGVYIWFAKDSTQGIVGTCALMKIEEGVFELTKMGVFKKARGMKAGEQLLQYVIKFSEEERHKLLFLLTNKKCQAAIHLYQKNGFDHCPKIMEQFGQKYDRCDVAMKI